MTIQQKQQLFQEQYHDLFSHVYTYIAFRVGHFATVEDLVSEICVRAYEHLYEFDPVRGTLRQWISGIMKYALIDYFRSRRETLEFSEEQLLLLPTVANLEQRLDHTMAYEYILDQLTPTLRFLLMLHYVDGWNYKEIAQLTGKSHASIRQTFSRLHAHLEKILLPHKADFEL